jgi:hypothetical protein
MARHGATRTQCLLVVLLAAPAAAEEVRPEFPASKGGTYSFTFENDIFGGDDRNYTNGVRLDYASPRNDLPFWARSARRNLRWLADAGECYATYGLDQNIYTPADISRAEPDPDDRP